MPYKDPKKRNEYQRKYNNAHKEEMRVYNLKRVKENPELMKANAKKWSVENKEKKNAISAKWKAANPEKVKERVEKISDTYIATFIKIPVATLRLYPEFIENYRMQIKVKRLLKNKKDDNTKTS